MSIDLFNPSHAEPFFSENIWIYWLLPSVIWNVTGFFMSFTRMADITVLRIVHDDVIKWKYFPRYWPFVRGIHRSSVNSPHQGQWRGALVLSLMCAWLNGRVNNREAGDLIRHRARYDVTVMNYYVYCCPVDAGVSMAMQSVPQQPCYCLAVVLHLHHRSR